MGKPYGDLVPSKLAAVLETIAFVGRRVLERGASLGLVVFHESAVPILPLTRSYGDFVNALSVITKTYEGSSLGDGIVWGVKILRHHRGHKVLIAVTDGEITGGVPLSLALAFAKSSGVDTRILLIGDEVLQEVPQELVRRVQRRADMTKALEDLLS